MYKPSRDKTPGRLITSIQVHNVMNSYEYHTTCVWFFCCLWIRHYEIWYFYHYFM